MSLLRELKRRNVFKVAVLYVVAAWCILQVTDVLASLLPVPRWTGALVFVLLVAGFLPALIVSWAYELTPDGLKREKDIAHGESITHETGRKINILIVVLLVVAIGVVAVDRLIPESVPGGETSALDPGELRPRTGDTLPAEAATVASAPGRSIAVLPFANMSGDKENEYFADGLSEEILNALAGVPDLQVTARTSSFQFKDQHRDVREVGQALNVAHVVEGSVRRSGDRARITAQLIRAGDGYHLWSETYDRTLDDIFEVQTDIAESITRALGVVMDDAQRAKMRREGIRDVEAFIAYQKGWAKFVDAHLDDVNLDSLSESGDWMTEAIRREPKFASAYFMRSDVFAHRATTEDVSPEERQIAYENYLSDLEAASRYARSPGEKAVIDVDRTLASSDWSPLPDKIEVALATNDCAETVWFESILPFGYAEEALDFKLRKVECDPLNYYSYFSAGEAALWAGHPEMALDMARRGLEIEQGDFYLTQMALVALLILDRVDEARKLAEASERWRDNLLAIVAAASGDLPGAGELGRRTVADATGWMRRYVDLHMSAITGDRQAANQAAGWFDALPVGQTILAAAVTACRCGAPFDLEATPVFTRRLEEAGFSWPPADLVKYPATQR